jgi:hypothetical protein
VFHALWAVTPDGRAFQQRIGAKEWKEPLEIKETDIDELIADITKTMKEIDRLTR